MQTGWYDICTRFHFEHPPIGRYCREDAIEATNRVLKNETYHAHKYREGLIDVVVLIIVGGEHVANFLTCQFFFESPDKDFFVRQTEAFKFDRGSYIEPLEKVPVFFEQPVWKMMEFLTRLARLMGEIGLAPKRGRMTTLSGHFGRLQPTRQCPRLHTIRMAVSIWREHPWLNEM